MRNTKQITYIRDGRSPIPTNETTSELMSAIKSKNTTPELSFRKRLWRQNIRGYRLHWKKAPGTPDIAFPRKKIAIFVNGCFWHRCPYCNLPIPKANNYFWSQKFTKNVERDARKIDALKCQDWNVVVVWECEIKKNPLQKIAKIRELITAK